MRALSAGATWRWTLSQLTPGAEELVRAARAALKPADGDCERVLQALIPQIGANPATGTGTGSGPGASPAPALGKVTLAKLAPVLLGVGAAGAGIWFSVQSGEPSTAVPPAALRVAPSVTAAGATPKSTEAPESGARTPQEVPAGEPPAAKRAAAATRATDSLAQEVAILSRAGSELHAGRPAAALATLDEHQRRFPNGVLSQERSAARIQALCALGRKQEAEAALARFARAAPGSPHLARARKACGASTSE